MPHMSAEIWLKPSFWSKIFDLFHAVKPGFRRVFAKAGFGDAWTLDQNYLSSLVITSSASQGNPFWLILLISVDPLEHLNTGEIVKISANRPRSIVDPFDIEYILITSCNMFHGGIDTSCVPALLGGRNDGHFWGSCCCSFFSGEPDPNLGRPIGNSSADPPAVAARWSSFTSLLPKFHTGKQ